MNLESRNLTKSFKSATETVLAVKGANLRISPGKITLVYGPSGSGKSTLLNLLAGIEIPDSGDILLEGKSITGLKDRERTKIRREQLGLVFQSFELIPVMTCFENIEYPLILRKIEKTERKQRVEILAKSLGIDGVLTRRPSKISGGQKQRVAIARTLVTQPGILLGDEITGNLDTHTGQQVMEFLKAEVKSRNMSVLLVTHDLGLRDYGDVFYHLVDGRLEVEA